MSNSQNLSPEVALEPERYELREPAQHHFDLERRDFFKMLGAGLLVACIAKDAGAFQESGGQRRQFGEPLPKEISAWMHIGENGVVTVYTGKVEVGQNIRTSLSQAAAEELRFPIDKIEMVMGDTRLTPFDMGTFGSRTTPTMNLQLRKVAAAARATLLAMAAKQWNCDPQQLTAADGRIFEKPASGKASKRSIEYAELVNGQQLTESIPDEDPLTPAADWTVEGMPVPKVDGRDFVTGKHRYPSDQSRTGMLHGKVLRPPSFGATLVTVDSPPAYLMNGVIFVHDGDFIGAAALDPEVASRALESIHAKWSEQSQISNKELFERSRGTHRRIGRTRVGCGGSQADPNVHDQLHRALPARTARSARRMVRRILDGLDRHATPLRRARAARTGLPHFGGPGPRPYARHWRRVWR